MKLATIFYHIDEFCKLFEKEFNVRVLSTGNGLREKNCSLSLSEVMTIMVYYYYSGYKTFSAFYEKSADLKPASHRMLTYNRFIELQQKTLMSLYIFAKLTNSKTCDNISCIDSFPLRVSHEKRIYSHKTFKKTTARGKTSMGWFYGFKVHIIINGKGEMVDFLITPGNVTDNNEAVIQSLTQTVQGKVHGDKGYLLNADLFQKLYLKGARFITKIRSNMKNRLMNLEDKMILKKQGLIESVDAVLKEDFNLEHSRYRNPITLFLNVFSTLIAYAFREKKPSIYKKGFSLLAA